MLVCQWGRGPPITDAQACITQQGNHIIGDVPKTAKHSPTGQRSHEQGQFLFKKQSDQQEGVWRSQRSPQGHCPACSGQGSQSLAPFAEAIRQLLCSIQSFAADADVAAAAVQVLLPLAGCATCYNHHGRLCQDELGQADAVEQLLTALPILSATQQQHLQHQLTNHSASGSNDVADAFLTLLFICSNHVQNCQRFLQAGGARALQMGLQSSGVDAVVAACLLLGQTVATAAAAAPNEQLSLVPDSLTTLAHVAAGQLNASGISSPLVMCAALWAIAQLVPAASAPSASSSSRDNGSSRQDLLGLYKTTLANVLLPTLVATTSQLAAAAGVPTTVANQHYLQQQQKQQRWLLAHCLQCCVMVWPMCNAAATDTSTASVFGLQSLRDALTIAAVHSIQVADCTDAIHSSVADPAAAQALDSRHAIQAYSHLLLQQLRESGGLPYDVSSSMRWLALQHRPPLEQLTACQLLQVLKQGSSGALSVQLDQQQQQQWLGVCLDNQAGGSVAPAVPGNMPTAVTVSAGATATIEVVYAGSCLLSKGAADSGLQPVVGGLPNVGATNDSGGNGLSQWRLSNTEHAGNRSTHDSCRGSSSLALGGGHDSTYHSRQIKQVEQTMVCSDHPLSCKSRHCALEGVVGHDQQQADYSVVTGQPTADSAAAPAAKQVSDSTQCQPVVVGASQSIGDHIHEYAGPCDDSSNNSMKQHGGGQGQPNSSSKGNTGGQSSGGDDGGSGGSGHSGSGTGGSGGSSGSSSNPGGSSGDDDDRKRGGQQQQQPQPDSPPPVAATDAGDSATAPPGVSDSLLPSIAPAPADLNSVVAPATLHQPGCSEQLLPSYAAINHSSTFGITAPTSQAVSQPAALAGAHHSLIGFQLDSGLAQSADLPVGQAIVGHPKAPANGMPWQPGAATALWKPAAALGPGFLGLRGSVNTAAVQDAATGISHYLGPVGTAGPNLRQQLLLQQQEGGGVTLFGSLPSILGHEDTSALEQQWPQPQQQQEVQQPGSPLLLPGAKALLPSSACMPSVSTSSLPVAKPVEPSAAHPPASPAHAFEQRALSGHLHSLNPGLMDLIAGNAPSLGSTTQAPDADHLLSWLSNDEFGRNSANIGTAAAAAPTAAATATATEQLGPVDLGPGPHDPAVPNLKAAFGQQAGGTRTGSSNSPDVPHFKQRDQDAGDAATAATDKVGPSSQETAAWSKAERSQPALARTAGVVDAVAAPPVVHTARLQSALSHVSSRSDSISRAGSLGSAAGSMAHSFSGDSLEDLESMRLNSAAFAAALAEAEAIAANMATAMAAGAATAPQQQQQHKESVATEDTRANLDASSPASGPDPTTSPAPQDAAAVGNANPAATYDPTELTGGAASCHLWLGNLHQRLPRSVLRGVFDKFGPVENVVTFPGRMYAFVNFKQPADAARAAQAVQDKQIPSISGNRCLVANFRPSRRALGKGMEAKVPGLVDPAGSSSGSSAANSERGSSANLLAAAAAAASTESAASGASQGAGPLEDTAQQVCNLLAALEHAQEPSSIGIQIKSLQTQGTLVGSSLSRPPGLTSSDTTDITQVADQGAGSLPAPPGIAAPSSSMSDAMAAAAAVAAAAAAVANSSSDSNAATAAHVAAAAAALAAVDAGQPQGPSTAGVDVSGEEADIPEGKPSRHLWLGNIPLEPNRGAMEALFSRFGPLESVRVFPGKTFAFVNFVHAAHAIAAKAALDGQPSPHITGPKPLVIRFQKDTFGMPPVGVAGKVLDLAAARGRKLPGPRSSLTGPGLLAPTASGSLAGLAEEENIAEPAVNLSNKLNPNNIHYDRELAAWYKRMSKAEKEALWAQDRAMQQLEHNPAAASLLSAAAAAAAGQMQQPSPAGLLHPALQRPHNAAAVGSNLYSQLLAANPQLAASSLAHAQAQQAASPAAAAAAALLQSQGLTGPANVAWNAQNNLHQHAVSLQPGMAAGNAAAVAAAAAAAAASNRLGLLNQQLGGYAGAVVSQGGGSGLTGLQQYLASGGASFNNPLLEQANQALLQQQLSGYILPGQQDPTRHRGAAAAAAGLHMSPAEDPAALAALSIDPTLLQAHLSGLQQQQGVVLAQGLGTPEGAMGGIPGPHGFDSTSTAAGASPGSSDTAAITALLASGGFAGLGGGDSMGLAEQYAGNALPRDSYPGGPLGMMGHQAGSGSGLSRQQHQHQQAVLAGLPSTGLDAGRSLSAGRQGLGQPGRSGVIDWLSRADSAAQGRMFDFGRANSGGAGLHGGPAAATAAGSGLGGLGPIGPPSAGNANALSRQAAAATLGSNLGPDQLPHYGMQQPEQQEHPGGAGAIGMTGSSSSNSAVQQAVAAAVAIGPEGPLPRQIICPLSSRIMTDPVIAADGFTYDRSAILDWLRLRDVSPLTGQPLSSAALEPNFPLRKAMAGAARLQPTGPHHFG